MPIGPETLAYRRALPHLIRDRRTYFVTFVTHKRAVMPPPARTLALTSVIHDHGTLHWLSCVVVMPDHVHLLLTPYDDIPLARIMSRVKGSSAHLINRLLGRSGPAWQRESFDHILRSDESAFEKAEYIRNNPLRKGLVSDADEWTWYWQV